MVCENDNHSVLYYHVFTWKQSVLEDLLGCHVNTTVCNNTPRYLFETPVYLQECVIQKKYHNTMFSEMYHGIYQSTMVLLCFWTVSWQSISEMVWLYTMVFCTLECHCVLIWYSYSLLIYIKVLHYYHYFTMVPPQFLFFYTHDCEL